MGIIVQFFAGIAPIIYLLILLGLLLMGRRLWRFWRETRESVFGLEREMAQKRVVQTISVMGLLILLGIAELVLESFLAPILPASAFLATPTMNPLAVPTTTLSPDLVTQMAAVPDATRMSEAVGCIPGQINITSPRPDQEIRGQITIQGSADIPNFGFYKYEVAAQGSEIWSTIQAGREVVRDGDLGFWDTTELTPGNYLLRLVVTDNQGQALPYCVVIVRVLGR